MEIVELLREREGKELWLAAMFVACISVLVFLSAQKKDSSKKGKKGKKNPSDEAEKHGGILRFIGRYLSGRDLIGEPRSEASWWRPGAPLPDVREAETPLADLARKESTSSVSLEKRPKKRVAVSSVAVSPVKGVWRALRVWHRWPHSARAAVRLAPAFIAFGVVVYPRQTFIWTVVGVAVLIVVAITGPSGLELWRIAVKWKDSQVYGPGLWMAMRQVIRVEESETRSRWLLVPDDITREGAKIVLRLPAKWVGSPESVKALDRIVEERVPGEWESRWERTGKDHYVAWKPKPKPKQRPSLPEYVPWRSTGSANRVFLGLSVEGYSVVDAVVETKTATPHWGVGGDTGSGKSTVLYIPVVHGRQNGELIDILDTKRNSLKEAEGHSGVRIHKTVRECIAAFGEFLTSMMAAEAALGKGEDLVKRESLCSRTLVVDELPTLIKLAYSWWKYGLKRKGTPPFLDWLGIILLQGRSSDHRVVVGTQQFANAFFGGTMERAQIGTRITVGQQDRTSWGVAYGQSTPVLGIDSSVKGRGAFSDKRKDPEGDHLYVREIQPSFITPHVSELLSQCETAPAWFDSGGMAPWITEEILAEVSQTAAVADFLPGGKHGPPRLPAAVVPAADVLLGGHTPRSQHATAGDATADATVGATVSDEADLVEESIPETYSLSEAHAAGILPWKAHTTRTYFKRGETRGISTPAGITDGQTAYYTEVELTEWLQAWTEWQEKRGTKRENSG